MPQMAPMSWVLLMAYFLVIFISYNILNYYMFMSATKKSSTKPLQSKVNWKW